MYPLSTKRSVPVAVAKPDYANDANGTPLSELRAKGSAVIATLSLNDQAKMRHVGRLSREVLNVARSLAIPGTTTDEIDRAVHNACIDRDCYPSPLNYMTFPKSCCTSVNEVICHGIPDQYELQDGDIVNIDVTAFYDGVHGDLNETYPVGSSVSAASKTLIRVAKECLDKAIAVSRPGVPYRDLGAIIQKHASANSLSVVKSYCGHGINSLFHCAPNVPHYAKNKASGIMKAGACATPLFLFPCSFEVFRFLLRYFLLLFR